MVGCLGEIRLQVALVPDQDFFHYNRESSSLSTQFSQGTLNLYSLGLDFGLVVIQEISEKGKLKT